MKVRWTERAQWDLAEINAYISRDNPDAARRWIVRLRERARKIAPHPYAGRKVSELDRDEVREVFLGSYRIIYEIYPKYIDILTIFEGHRLFPLLEPESEE